MSELTPERWQKIKDICIQLADRSPDEWRDILPQLCGGDEELQRDVRHFLEIQIGQFLNGDSRTPSISHTEILLANGEVLAGRYRIGKPIGCGGMADVYEVEDMKLKKPVALKVIRSEVSFDEKLPERLCKEVELSQRINHRNVCRVHDIGHGWRGDRELIFLTMELIPGETMAERLRRSGPLPPSEWLPVAKQLCKALNEAHRMKVLHRDFKPGNVMLVESGENIRAVVTDFGIASAMDSDKGLCLSLTAKYLLIGTPLYMSPEQKRGEELAATSDIYSLGLVLYEMITGKPYLHYQQIERIPKRFENWRQTIQRCLDPDPAKRFASALEVLDSIKAEILPSLPPPPWIWSLLRMSSITTVIFVVLVVSGWLLNIGANPLEPVLPLPLDKEVAFLLPQANADLGLGVRVHAWSEATIRQLSRVRVSTGKFGMVPWDSVKDLRPGNADLAWRRIGFNVYTVSTITKQARTIDFSIELWQADPKLRLRKLEFSVPENSDVESVLAKRVANLLDVPEPTRSESCSSPVPAACDSYIIGMGYLAQRDRSRIDLAIDNFEQAIRKDPSFATAWADLAFASALKYRSTRDTLAQQRAVLAHEKAIRLNSALPRAHVAFGLILQDMGTIADAIDEFKQALSLDPSDSDVRSLLSMAYLKVGNRGEAKRLLEEAIKLDPLFWFNYNDLGYFYYRNGELADAEMEFRESVARAPDNPIANGVLATVCVCFGKYAEAEEITNKLLKFRKSAMADENLALIYEHRSQYGQAVKLLQEAVQRQPSFDLYWLELGDAFALQGARSDAVKSYHEALKQAEDEFKRDPSDNDLLGRLALYHAKLGQKSQALRELKEATAAASNIPDPELPLISARVYELTGQREAALNMLHSAAANQCIRRAVEIIPDFAALRSDRRYPEIQLASL